jgi:serine/threonine protein kinase
MIGKTISHYKISGKLGEGGMGVVYKAEDTKLGRTVALKFLPPQSLGGEEERARFVREARAAAALDHSSICTTYEIDEAEGRTFIAMAFVDGQSLEERITSSGPLEPKEAVGIAAQVAEGLGEAHEKGIVHRDIKSANIMLGSRGQAKITDFGLAMLAGASKLTKTATIMGTVSYMSPEQALGEAVDWRTDIWSLGVVLYEMLTGKLPFMANNEAALLHKIIYDEPGHATGVNPYVPPGLSVVVAKAMTKDRGERYQSMAEFLRDIRNFQSLQSVEASAPRTAASEEPVFSLKDISDKRPEAYERAEQRVKERMRFNTHLKLFILINSTLLVINLLTSPRTLWFKFPLLVFAVFLGMHAFKIFVLPDSDHSRDRLMEKELKREATRKR